MSRLDLLISTLLSTLLLARAVWAQTIPITGTNIGGLQPRLEIRTLQQNADAFNLFLLAIDNFKWLPQTSNTSYYQIAGIHGVPNIPWDGVQGNPNQAVGYCPHVSPLFPAWHRIYVALFEQFFTQSVNNVVSQFSGAQQARYAQQAATLRFPYWDWAAAPVSGQPVLPAAITQKYVNVTTPSGPQTWLNPLFRFDNHPLDHAAYLDSPWDNWVVTLRYPNSTDPVAVMSVEQNTTNTVQSDNPNLRARIYNLFTTCSDYAGFGNSESSARTQSCQDSLESIHNNIHSDMGGPNGHMTILWYAAMDPVFWLHHANVDRLFALWQGLYPTSFNISATTQQATYAIPSGTPVNGDTFLAPFHNNTSGGQWTSNLARNHTSLGYTYPEFLTGDNSPAGIRAKVNALYGNGNTVKQKRSFPLGSELAGLTSALPIALPSNDVVSGVISNIIPTVPSAPAALPTSLSALLTPEHESNVEYTTTIASQGFSLGGSYDIYIFVGQPASETPSSWATDPKLAGKHCTFSAPGMHTTTLVTGTVPLTRSLVTSIAFGQLKSLAPAAVLPFLTSNINWRIMKSDGTAVDSADVPGLTVGVQSASVTPAKNLNAFPTIGNWTLHNNVTHGKKGGIQLGMKSDWWRQCACEYVDT